MLTIDIGNTHVKWAVWKDRHIIQSGIFDYSKQEPESAFIAWVDLQAEKRVVVACVAGENVEKALKRWMLTHWSVEPEFLRTTKQFDGVTNAYSDPSGHGVDRWAALLGARSLYTDPVCIIDAGTAITVDLMDEEGNHLGGRILPGLRMMSDALLEGADGIRQTEGAVVAFAKNTADAVSSGTLHMLQAGLVEICATARQHLGSDMRIIITGGMSDQIMSFPGLPVMLHEPDLVLTGLRVAAETRPAGI